MLISISVVTHFTNSEFTVGQLESNTTYSLVVTANNTHGHSSAYPFKVTTKASGLGLLRGIKDWIDGDRNGHGTGGDFTAQDSFKLLPVVAGLAGRYKLFLKEDLRPTALNTIKCQISDHWSQQSNPKSTRLSQVVAY